MLVLQREVNQTICIGDDIRVTVMRTGTRTRLGITAPAGVPIDREEIYLEKRRDEANAIAARDQAEVNESAQPARSEAVLKNACPRNGAL